MFSNLKENNPLLIIAGIVFIPVVIAGVSLWVDVRIDKRQRQAAEELFQRQERLTLTQTIDAYFQGVGAIFMNESNREVRDRIIVARTNALLNRLSTPRDRALVVRFVSQMDPTLTQRPKRALERSAKPFIDLADLDLSGADLSFANLFGANLSGTKLTGSNLIWANLTQANLRNATLEGADLRGAELSRADLAEATLREARIGGANFHGADLRGADLRQADPGAFEFEGLTTRTNVENAKLDGALWFDGSQCADNAGEACRVP